MKSFYSQHTQLKCAEKFLNCKEGRKKMKILNKFYKYNLANFTKLQNHLNDFYRIL
jgi:hypothetical protein